MKTLEVVVAIIKKDNKILCTQRADDGRFLSLKWEFPGGKIEKGETHQEALIREIQEELKLDIDVDGYFMTIEHIYPHFKLIMHSYFCKMKEEKITLEEHNNYKWLSIYDLNSLDWAEADILIVKALN